MGIGITENESVLLSPSGAGRWWSASYVLFVANSFGFSTAFPMLENGILHAQIEVSAVDIFFEKKCTKVIAS
jgi:hypothetical protein